MMRLYLCAEVNGNQVSSVMMVGIGRASYFIDGPNSENVFSGGFTTGHGGNVTVIKVSPPVPSLFTRFRPHLAHFPPVFPVC